MSFGVYFARDDVVGKFLLVDLICLLCLGVRMMLMSKTPCSFWITITSWKTLFCGIMFIDTLEQGRVFLRIMPWLCKGWCGWLHYQLYYNKRERQLYVLSNCWYVYIYTSIRLIIILDFLVGFIGTNIYCGILH